MQEAVFVWADVHIWCMRFDLKSNAIGFNRGGSYLLVGWEGVVDDPAILQLAGEEKPFTDVSRSTRHFLLDTSMCERATLRRKSDISVLASAGCKFVANSVARGLQHLVKKVRK